MHSLANDYTKNYCNWTLIVQVIVENVVSDVSQMQCTYTHKRVC